MEGSSMKKLILLAALLAGTAHAQFMSGNELLDRLNDPGTAKPMVALGYVMGVLDAHYNTEICPPEQVQIGQASDVIKQWLQNNPDKRHLPAAIIVRVILRQTWPCKAPTTLTPGGKS
jgi:hypothetical protein